MIGSSVRECEALLGNGPGGPFHVDWFYVGLEPEEF